MYSLLLNLLLSASSSISGKFVAASTITAFSADVRPETFMLKEIL